MNYIPIEVRFNAEDNLNVKWDISDNSLNIRFKSSYRKGKKNKLYLGDEGQHIGNRLSNNRM